MNFTFEIPSEFVDALENKLQNAVSQAVRDTVDIVKFQWEQIARNKLRSTFPDYYAALNRPDSVEFPDPFTAIITLRGKWANMLETGFPPFDMKKGFQRSKKAKKSKNGGWYLTIPFRHLTPTAQGVIGGRPMPPSIYQRARQLQPGQRLTGTERLYPPQVSWTGYQHKNGIYEGMIRNVKQYQRSGVKHGTYYTFRRVSNKSDPASWWHPGFEGVHAVQQIKPIAEKWLRTTLQYYLASLE